LKLNIIKVFIIVSLIGLTALFVKPVYAYPAPVGYLPPNEFAYYTDVSAVTTEALTYRVDITFDDNGTDYTAISWDTDYVASCILYVYTPGPFLVETVNSSSMDDFNSLVLSAETWTIYTYENNGGSYYVIRFYSVDKSETSANWLNHLLDSVYFSTSAFWIENEMVDLIDEAYEMGKTDGQDDYFIDSDVDGYDDDSYDAGFVDGQDDVFTDSDLDGYDDDSYNAGIAFGYGPNYNSGESDGFADGVASVDESMTSILSFVPGILGLGFGFFMQIASVHALGISGLDILATLFSIALILFVFKVFLKN